MASENRNRATTYRHTQHAPLCWGLYLLCIPIALATWLTRGMPVLQWLFPVVGLAMLWLAASFHHLTVEDEGDRISIRFGPLPTFRRSVRYDEIVDARLDRTTVMDGWGIHFSPRGGWVWNLWGRQCVLIQMRRGTLRVGSDDAERLAEFLQSRRG
ncbi:hypothetical protein [Rosistilla oblonga]|uniref:hypothetical protein n=1 Tax=Rosistilla oblonga TaxID=2527990 RepID=UPI003A97DE45